MFRLAGHAVAVANAEPGALAAAGLPRADQHRILALPYPVEFRVFWKVLADLGVTEERLMDRMGASP
jgi:hypothetical protein